MNEKFLEQLKSIYTKLGGEEDLTSENSLIEILKKIYSQMGGEKDFKDFSIPEAIDLIEDEVGNGGGEGKSLFELAANEAYICPAKEVSFTPSYRSEANDYYAAVTIYDNITFESYSDRTHPVARFKVEDEYMPSEFQLDESTRIYLNGDAIKLIYNSPVDPGEVVANVPEIIVFCAKDEIEAMFGMHLSENAPQ